MSYTHIYDMLLGKTGGEDRCQGPLLCLLKEVIKKLVHSMLQYISQIAKIW